jgi:hypothetical protein
MRGHAREDRSYKQSPHHAHRRPSASGQSTTSSLDSRSRLAPSTAYNGTSGPISPIDFTISRKTQENQQGLHSYRGQDDKDYGRFKRSDFGDPSSSSASKTYMPTRIAQAVIIKNLHQASDLVQATLLEVRLILTHKMVTLSPSLTLLPQIIIVQQLKIHSATYNVPNPFIVVAILPQDAPSRCILSQLVRIFTRGI